MRRQATQKGSLPGHCSCLIWVFPGRRSEGGAMQSVIGGRVNLVGEDGEEEEEGRGSGTNSFETGLTLSPSPPSPQPCYVTFFD